MQQKISKIKTSFLKLFTTSTIERNDWTAWLSIQFNVKNKLLSNLKYLLLKLILHSKQDLQRFSLKLFLKTIITEIYVLTIFSLAIFLKKWAENLRHNE